MRNYLSSGACICVALLLAGCMVPPSTSVYRSADEENSQFASSGVDPLEYGRVCKTMVESILSKDLRTEAGAKPMIVLGQIANTTPYNVQTRMLAEKIRVNMLKSEAVRFSMATDYSQKGGESGDLYKQLQFQNESGHCDPATIKHYGQLIAADYVLFGRVYNIERRSGGRTQAYFSFILNLYVVKTGEVIWSEESEITKVL